MAWEISTYLANSGGLADSTALYFVWGDANDFLAGDSPIQAAQNVASYVSTLVFFQFYIAWLKPHTVGQGRGVPAKKFTTAFNTELVKQLNNISTIFPAADIIQFDIFYLINENIQNPADARFTEVQMLACLLTWLRHAQIQTNIFSGTIYIQRLRQIQ